MSDAYAVGIDLGGSSVKAVAVTLAGKTLATANESFNPERMGHWAETVRATLKQLEQQAGAKTAWVGASAPGLASRDETSIAFLPGRLAGLEGWHWAQELGKSAVPVLNDAHAALLGETWLGAARGCRNVIMLTLGTGVGGAAMVDGQLLRGHTGKAGHLGHSCLDPEGPPDICYMPGSLEVAMGNCTIRERSGGKFSTTHELIAAHLAGDAFATQVWLKSVKALACAIGTFTNILDPEVAVIGGGIARAGAALFEPLERMVRAVEWRTSGHEVRLARAEMGELAGAYGAAWKAFKQAEVISN